MKAIIAVVILTMAGTAVAIYVSQQQPQTSADLCRRATRQADGSIHLRGPVLVVGTTFGNQRLERNTINKNGVDIFDFVDRACPAN